MFPRTRTLLLLCFTVVALCSSCAAPTPAESSQTVTVYTTSAASSWLNTIYDCGEKLSTVIVLADAPDVADIRLQIGEPKYLSSFAYQIDYEDILIVTHRQSPVQNLTLDQAQALFAGLSDPSVQVWVFAPEDDVQKVFDQFVMKGRSVSSSANVAASPQQVSDVLNAESTSVGILPRHWKTGDTREVYSVATVPVLAITQSEPQGAVNQLIGCLQK